MDCPPATSISLLTCTDRFSPKEDVAASAKLKSSSQRAVRAKLLEQMPTLARPLEGAENEETVMDSIWPKKEDVQHVRWCVASFVVTLQGYRLILVEVGNTYRSSLSMARRCSSNISTDRITLPSIFFTNASTDNHIVALDLS
jgi:hypothetical protein